MLRDLGHQAFDFRIDQRRVQGFPEPP